MRNKEGKYIYLSEITFDVVEDSVGEAGFLLLGGAAKETMITRMRRNQPWRGERESGGEMKKSHGDKRTRRKEIGGGGWMSLCCGDKARVKGGSRPLS